MPDAAVTAPLSQLSPERGPGLYGKLPARGDFLTRRLSRGFVDAFDGWVQASLEASREQLGERWLETYLTSPIWRFALSPGVAGDAAMLGVMIPSVDSAGRYFPFTIASSLDALARDDDFTPQLEDVLRGGLDGWLAEAERLALLGLGEHLDLEAYDTAVASMAPPLPETLAGPTPALMGEPAATARNAWRFGGAGGAAVSHVAPEMLTALLDRALGRYSVWWTMGSQAMAPSRLACEGLPAAERFVAMLDGGYAARGWQDRPSPLLQAAPPAVAPPAEPLPEPEAAAEEKDDGSDTVVNENTDTVLLDEPEPTESVDTATDDEASTASLAEDSASEPDADFDPWSIPVPKPRKRAEDDTTPQPRRQRPEDDAPS